MFRRNFFGNALKLGAGTTAGVIAGSSAADAARHHNHRGGHRCPEIGSVRMDPLVPLAAVPGDYQPAFSSNAETGRSWATVEWNEARNRVRWQVHFDHLPYRPTVTRPADSNPRIQSGNWVPDYPNTVEDGVYQFWMIPLNPVVQTCYYDPGTLDFIGTARTLDELPPIDEAIVTNEPETFLACSPLTEPDPDTGRLDFSWETQYDKVYDAVGNGGTTVVYTPMNLTHAGERALVVTTLPPEDAMPFSFFHQGAGLAIDSTLEPDPKPADLISTYNPITIQGQIANFPLPPGLAVDIGVTNQVYPLPPLPYAHPLVSGVEACS